MELQQLIRKKRQIRHKKHRKNKLWDPDLPEVQKAKETLKQLNKAEKILNNRLNDIKKFKKEKQNVIDNFKGRT